MSEEQEMSGLKRLALGARDFLYGMAGHDMTRFALKTRGSMEHLFILITMATCLACPSCRPITPCGSCPT